MASLWEFPGGKIEAGESPEQALARELDEELGIQAAIGPPVTRIRHNYRHGGAVDLQFFAVHEFTGEIDNQIYQQVRWVRLEDLTGYDFLAADLTLIRDLASSPEVTRDAAIARPFAGEQGSFVRTEGRRDLAIAPPGRSYLQELEQAGVEVMAVGKVDDLFASRGITTAHPGSNNAQALASVERLLAEGRRGLIFANLIETDQLYGHRKDTAGFHAALRRIDQALGRIRATLGPGDLLIVTADHGVDLAHPGTDHTREYVPLLALTGEMERARAAGGTRGGVGHDGPMADVGASA